VLPGASMNGLVVRTQHQLPRQLSSHPHHILSSRRQATSFAVSPSKNGCTVWNARSLNPPRSLRPPYLHSPLPLPCDHHPPTILPLHSTQWVFLFPDRAAGETGKPVHPSRSNRRYAHPRFPARPGSAIGLEGRAPALVLLYQLYTVADILQSHRLANHAVTGPVSPTFHLPPNPPVSVSSGSRNQHPDPLPPALVTWRVCG